MSNGEELLSLFDENSQESVSERTKYHIKCTAPGCNETFETSNRWKKFCTRHSARMVCAMAECENPVRRKGLCSSHLNQDAICKKDGCNNRRVRNGLCRRHDKQTNEKKCIMTGCSNMAVEKGVCCKHGAPMRKCRAELCTKPARDDGTGFCNQHFNGLNTDISL